MKFLPKTIDSQFLVRIIRNEAGPEEREYFEKWLEESEENKEEFSSLLLLWDKFKYSHLPSVPQTEKQWEKIEKAISGTVHPFPDSDGLSFPQFKSSAPVIKKPRKKNYLIWFTVLLQS
ncbi:MAG: hypothetical protein EHM47_17440 [Ignavibacteriales bacterium]|nr:MAG: hypothetical protein EHM47_17440 [Ignavibacteriales bacterium]